MGFVKDECGQGAAEYILLFGGVIVIAIVALWIYQDYIKSIGSIDASTDILNVRAA